MAGKEDLYDEGLDLAFDENYAGAIEKYQAALEIAPDDILAHTSLSTFYMNANMIPEAEAESAKARMLDWKRQLKEGGDS